MSIFLISTLEFYTNCNMDLVDAFRDKPLLIIQSVGKCTYISCTKVTFKILKVFQIGMSYAHVLIPHSEHGHYYRNMYS